jgi:microcystin-dependent protein
MEGYFIAQIALFAGTFNPISTFKCQGQLLSIDDYTALFALIGTTYGGDGQVTFALPDFRGRIPVGQGAGPGLTYINLGEVFGASTRTLTTNNMPSHTHTASVNIPVKSASATTNVPNGNVPATAGAVYYGDSDSADGNLEGVSGTVGATGSSSPFNLGMPALAVTFLIFVEGVFPSRN